MAISYKNDYGADLMDFGIIDWFGSGGNSGGYGGAGVSGVGGAIGTAGALILNILTDKEKWEKLFGGMDTSNPLYKPYQPPATEEQTKPNETVIDPPQTETGGNVVIDPPQTETPSVPETKKPPWTSTDWWNGTIFNPPKVEDVPKVETEVKPEPEPPIIKEEEPVEDKTFANIEKVITQFDPLKWAEEQQAKMWTREDAIRAETQAREDNAYQRTIEDMQRAGINPNLLGNITPAASGGGISNATPADTALAQKQMEKDMELLKQTIDQAFKEDENQKDRVWSLIEKILGAGAMLGGAAIR